MIKLQTIECDKYEKMEDNIHVRRVGMITGREAFNLLSTHLENVSLLPDEYFSPSVFSNLDTELPDFRDAICHTNWGGSEGIYIDITLRYIEDGQTKYYPFATGKTLESNGDAFLKMSRIAAECSMMLNGRGCMVRVSENAYENLKSPQDKNPSLIDQIQSAAVRSFDSAPCTAGKEKTVTPEL